MLEAGEHATIADLAHAEKIGRSYVSRALGLAFLAPDLVEAILDGRQGEAVALEVLLGGVPVGWAEQRHRREFGLLPPPPSPETVTSPNRTGLGFIQYREPRRGYHAMLRRDAIDG